MSKPTIRDVAAQAGVSISVASNALNDKGRVSARTRQRVKQAAQEIGYVPSYSARRLRGKDVRAIGVIVAVSQEEVFSTRYFSEATHAFGLAAAASGYKLHYIHLSELQFSPTSLYETLSDGAVDGVIIVAPILSQVDMVIQAMAELPHIPYVLFSASPDRPGVSYVDSDGQGGARLAIRHLLDLGHQRIAYVGPPEENSNALDRLRGSQAAMREAGLTLLSYSVEEWDGPLPLDQMLADQVTAVFTFDDLTALRTIGDLRRCGLQVPDDVAVIGFDDERFGKVTYPALTTIYQPLSEMSIEAVNYLVRCLDGEATEPYRKVFPVKLIVRDSCGAHATANALSHMDNVGAKGGHSEKRQEKAICRESAVFAPPLSLASEGKGRRKARERFTRR